MGMPGQSPHASVGIWMVRMPPLRAGPEELADYRWPLAGYKYQTARHLPTSQLLEGLIDLCQ
jgi:hypothetical protein